MDNITIKSGTTLTILPGTSVKFASGKSLTVNGAVNAIGTSSQPIVFASSSPTPTKGIWNKIQLNSGPNTLQYCKISYPNHGLWVSNSSTTLIDHCTVENCLNYGIYSLNTNKATNSCNIQYSIVQNCNRALYASNGRADAVLSTFQNNSMYGINANNGTVYFGNCLLTGNGSSGVYEQGSGNVSRVYFSIMTPAYGCNAIRDNLGGEVFVMNGQAYIGSYDPGTGQWTCGGNTISDGLTWSGHLVTNASTLLIPAQKEYWGTNTTNAWQFSPGAIDVTYPLTSAPTECSPPGAPPPQTVAQWDQEGFGKTDPVISHIHNLVRAIQDNSSDAYQAFYELSSWVGVGGSYRDVLSAPTWSELLDKTETSSASKKLRSVATIFKTEEKIASGDVDGVFRTANQMPSIVSTETDPDLWEYLNETKLALLLQEGRVSEAIDTYSSIRRAGLQSDTTIFSEMEALIAEVARDSENIQMWAEAKKEASLQNGSLKNQSLPVVPDQYQLGQNYPNPFNPTTTITYAIVNPGRVTLKVYNVIGQVVATLVDQIEAAGERSVQFDASKIPSGLYFYKLQTDRYTAVKKMVLIK